MSVLGKKHISCWLAGISCLLLTGVAAALPVNDVFADANWSRTMTYVANREGYDSPGLTISANVNDEGIIISDVQITPVNGFTTDRWCAVEGTYNGKATVVESNTSEDAYIELEVLKNPNRVEVENCVTDWSEDSQEETFTVGQDELGFTFGETFFQDLTDRVFSQYVGSYKYTDKNGTESYILTINNCDSDTVEHVSGPRNCHTGDFSATEHDIQTINDGYTSYDMSKFVFQIGRNGESVYRLNCGAALTGSTCGGNSWKKTTSDKVVTYTKSVESMEEVMGGAEEPVEEDPLTGEVIDDSGGTDDDGVEDPCYSNSGAMGWIMCPLINGISGALEALYGFVEGLLEVPPELLNNDPRGTYSAWNLFRNIANVLLIVAILAIILSQLTGFGINNYGIKKMLPRVVALAIIINVSYIICQLAVDLSNIVGYSLKDFLGGVAGSISGMSSGGSWFNGVLLEVTGVIAIGGAVTAIALSGWALIVPILLTLITAVLAVLFMFILLGVRQALVVLLVALSPVIVVLYTLPNTQKLAQRATRMFSGLLMMFPLAGLLIGGSQLASAILISSGSSSNDATVTWLMQLIGLALMVVPYFFLPMVLRSSLQLADGALGKISGLTQRGSGALRGAAKGKAENSAYARRFNQNNINRKLDRQRKRVERRTGKFKEGRGIARLGAPGRALASARLQAAESVYAQTANQAQGAEKMLDEAAMASAVQAYGSKSVTDISKAAKSAIDSKFTDTDAGKRQFKALVAMLADRKDGEAELEKLMRDLAIGQDNVKNVSAFQEALTPEVMGKIKGKSVVAGALAGAIAGANTKTGASYGQHANGKPMSYQEFAQDAVKKASVEDLVGQSNGSFKRSFDMISDSQIDAMHDDAKSMNRLSQENRDRVSSNYNTRHPRNDSSGGDLSPDKKVDLH